MKYILDTNIMIARLNGNLRIGKRLQDLRSGEAILCSPVLAELEYGACYSARKEENLSRLRELAAGMRFQPFGSRAAVRFGELKAAVRKQGKMRDDFDLAIAAVALDLEAVLVSDDTDFHDGAIPGIQVENWLER